jgi:hypothetical protein
MVNLGRRRFTQSKCSLVAGDAEDTEYAFAMEIVIATAGRVQSHTTPQRYVAASRPAGADKIYAAKSLSGTVARASWPSSLISKTTRSRPDTV